MICFSYKYMYQHRSTWASMLMVIPFHVMAMVIQNSGFRWRSENQENFLKSRTTTELYPKLALVICTSYYQATSDLNDILHDYLTCVAPFPK